MITLTKEEKKFIKAGRGLIEDGEWTNFYIALIKSCKKWAQVGRISQFLYEDCEVDFLNHLDGVIPEYCFYNSDIKSIIVPNSVTKIYDYAFAICNSLESITIPDPVKYIGEAAFKNCISLQSITLPNSLKEIIRNTFEGCASLQSINIPNLVNTIGKYAFHDCVSLQSIEIPNSVEHIGECVFEGCISLQSIKLYHNSYAEEWCKENNLEDKIEYLD